ncbi:U-actitoxin-Avd3i-like [Ptychodera flava]|uniref:U-actitoxin-Avd3i-like n=1 Tax=Ptychodera flava TaxID=63121 RepID=UPI00396A41ED
MMAIIVDGMKWRVIIMVMVIVAQSMPSWGSNTLLKLNKRREELQVAADICKLPAETGPCRAAFRRWFFNTTARECQEFIYGGCGGNGNNFRRKRECERACKIQRSDAQIFP